MPELSLVVLVGASGSGKSTFARTHFLSTEVVSSDACRGLVADDENDQSATKDAFEPFTSCEQRMEGGRLTVVDATSVSAKTAPTSSGSHAYHFLPVAIVFSSQTPLPRPQPRPARAGFRPACGSEPDARPAPLAQGLSRRVPPRYVLTSPEDVEAAVISGPGWNTARTNTARSTLSATSTAAATNRRLLGDLGYWDGDVQPPGGRKAVFVGDLVDRGPRIVDSIRLVKRMVEKLGALRTGEPRHQARTQAPRPGRADRRPRSLAGRPIRSTRSTGTGPRLPGPRQLRPG